MPYGRAPSRARLAGHAGVRHRGAVRSLFVVAFVLASCGCADLGSDPYVVRDAGPTPAVDAAAVASLIARYLSVADAQGTVRCRCAGDVPLCRRQLEADWDANGQACLAQAIARDFPGFESGIACLETAVGILSGCDAPLVCASVGSRIACSDAYVGSGSSCLDGLTLSARAMLVACTPTTDDAGTP